jgi:predicted nuclease of predicted toxin-antitoxin system
LVSTGNISNEELWSLFRANLEAIEKEFKSGVFVEINRTELILHG